MITDLFGLIGKSQSVRQHIGKLIDDPDNHVVIFIKGDGHRGIAYTTNTIEEARQLLKEAVGILQCQDMQPVNEKSIS